MFLSLKFAYRYVGMLFNRKFIETDQHLYSLFTCIFFSTVTMFLVEYNNVPINVKAEGNTFKKKMSFITKIA